jgi:hypothetical protein
MEQVGIYEKLITQLIDKSINRDVFYFLMKSVVLANQLP